MALLSVWGIILVLIGHSGFEESEIQQKLHVLHGWIYSFHMPLFFMISGYLFSLTNKNFTGIKTGKFLQKKITRLIVPYLTLGTILWGIKYTFSGFSHATRDFSTGTFLKMFIAPGCDGSTMGYLWYVFTLFMIFSVVVVLNKIHIDMKKSGWCIGVMLVFWLMWGLFPKIIWVNWSIVCRDLPFFVAGILLHKYEPKILTLINKGGGKCNLIILSSFSICLQFFDLPVGTTINYIFKAFVGLIMSIQLCSMLLKYKWVERYLLPLGQYTYSIYLLSWFGHYAAKILLVNVLHMHWGIVMLGMFIGGLLLPLIICRIVDKSDWLSKQKWLRIVIGY